MQAVEKPGIEGFNLVPSKMHITPATHPSPLPLPIQGPSIILGTKSSEALSPTPLSQLSLLSPLTSHTVPKIAPGTFASSLLL